MRRSVPGTDQTDWMRFHLPFGTGAPPVHFIEYRMGEAPMPRRSNPAGWFRLIACPSMPEPYASRAGARALRTIRF